MNRIRERVLRYQLLFLCLLGLTFWPVQAQNRPIPTTPAPATEAANRPPGPEVARATNNSEQEDLSFGLDKVDFLQPKLFGAPRWKYLASAIYLLLAWIVAKLLDRAVGGWLKFWLSKAPGRTGELVIKLVHGPIKIITLVILLHMGLQALHWPDSIEKWTSKGLHLAVACSLTYTAVHLVGVLVDYWRQRASGRSDGVLDDHLFPVLNKSLKIFVLIVAILVTCQNLGIDITAALASLSIGGLALGLAAQDTVANLFGAVAVFVDKPFRVGDRIKLEAIDGVVESIGLRSTRVRNLDGHLITVPNKTMGNATITNVSRRPTIKTELNIGLTYDTPAEKVKAAVEILREIYGRHAMTSDLLISFNKFADSALNISVVHWWANTDYRAYVAGMQELNLAIKARFDSEGLDFAFPTQTLYVKGETDGLARLSPADVPAPIRN